MQHRRTGALVGAALLTLAACGSSSDSATPPVADERTAATEVPVGDFSEGDSTEEQAADVPATNADAAVSEASDVESTDAPAEDPVDGADDADGAQPDVTDVDLVTDVDPVEEDPVDVDPVEEEAAVDEAPPAEPVATDAPEPAAASEPVVGGRLFAPDVEAAAQFDGNPFPDLVVEDIGKDAQVNIKNILPSDRPVLLWAWAPH